jgi:hypothetical protein
MERDASGFFLSSRTSRGAEAASVISSSKNPCISNTSNRARFHYNNPYIFRLYVSSGIMVHTRRQNDFLSLLVYLYVKFSVCSKYGTNMYRFILIEINVVLISTFWIRVSVCVCVCTSFILESRYLWIIVHLAPIITLTPLPWFHDRSRDTLIESN